MPPIPLTTRQQQIVRLIALGTPQKQIADLLEISSGTLDWELYGNERLSGHNSISYRLGFTCPALLTHYAIAIGLVKPGEPFSRARETRTTPDQTPGLSRLANIARGLSQPSTLNPSPRRSAA
jgi:hypothetical protein